MKKPKVIIKKAGKKTGQRMVVIKSYNGRVLHTSEVLSSKRNARANLKSLVFVISQFIKGRIKLTEE